MAFRDNGVPGPAIVLIHGNSASSAAWLPMYEEPVARQRRLVALDMPGCGASGRLASYSVTGLGAAIRNVAAAIGCEDGVFVGHSLGGHLLIEAMPKLPRARGFVVAGAPPLRKPPNTDEAFLESPALGFGLTGELTDQDINDWIAALFAPQNPVPDGLFADMRRADPRVRSGIQAGLASLEYTDEAEVVRMLRQPIAVLHGRLDAMVSRTYVESLPMPTLWRGRVQVIEGAGHYAHVERPAEFAALLGEFADDVFTAGR